MEESKRFGVKLRELRIKAGMTQRELAGRITIDFTYLSKIENGVMPPPSEKVILQLATALNTDRDELLTLAGKIPPDIAKLLKDQETIKFLRSDRVQKKVGADKEEAVHRLEGLKNLPKANIPHKNFVRVAAATILVVLFGTLLWFASPTTDTAVAVNNQGVVYNKEGEYHEAISAFDKAIELDPDLAIAYNNRSWAYIELGQYEQAIADCDKAIELDPGLALAYSNRGLAYIELGQYEQAIADFDRAMELDPNLQK